MATLFRQRVIRSALAVGALLFGMSGIASAQLLGHPNWQLRGFGTLGLARSESNHLVFQSDLKQTASIGDSWTARSDSVLGGQLRGELTEAADLVVQVVVKDRRDYNLDNLLRFAYLDLAFTPNMVLRLGRNPHDIRFLSDTRDVGFSYLWVRPISEYYDEYFVDYYDGVDFSYRFKTGNGVLTTRLLGGEMDVDLSINVEPEPIAYESFVGVKLGYQQGDFELNLGYQRAKVGNTSELLTRFADAWATVPESVVTSAPRLAKNFDIEGAILEYYVGGISWQPGNWQFQGEVGKLYMPEAMGIRATAGYVSAAYKIGSVTPYLVASRVYNHIDPLGFDEADISAMPAPVQGLAETTRDIHRSFGSRQKSVALGLRWDFHSKMALKVQWNMISVDTAGHQIWMPRSDQAANGDDFNMYAVTLDFFL